MLSIRFSNTGPLSVIAGPCAIEGRQQTLEAAAALKEIFLQAGVPLIFKSSFDKANRSSGASYRGVGMTEGLSILAEVRERYDVPVIPLSANRLAAGRGGYGKTGEYQKGAVPFALGDASRAGQGPQHGQ